MVSVIIPVYNVEKYLRQCVESVLVQTYPHYEIILVDDGSTDSSGAICDEYTARNGAVSVIHQQNAGLSQARNAGFDSAKGRFVYFLDSDDWIEKETLSALARKAHETNADIVFFDAKSFEDSDRGYNIPQRYIRKNRYEAGAGLKVFEQLQRQREFHSAVPLFFISREFLTANGIRFYPGILYEDMLYSFEMLAKARVAAQCGEAFYQRRYRVNSITQSALTERNYRSAATVCEELTAFAQNEQILHEACVRQYIVRCAYRVLDIYAALSKADRQKCKAHYQAQIDAIRRHDGFGDKALLLRCKSKLHWGVYKIAAKLGIR